MNEDGLTGRKKKSNIFFYFGLAVMIYGIYLFFSEFSGVEHFREAMVQKINSFTP